MTNMITVAFSTPGPPLAGDPVPDMARTATNVAGRPPVPTVVAAGEGRLERAAYDSTARRDPVEPVPAPA